MEKYQNASASRTMASTEAMIKAEAAPTKCHLLGLPPELLNRIWEYAVIEDHAIYLDYRSSYSKNEKPETGAQPSITQACSQIRAGTLQMFYALNVFRLDTANLGGDNGDDTDDFLRLLEAQVQSLRHIDVQVCSHDNRYRLDLHESKRTIEWRRVLADESSEKDCVVVESDDFEIAKRYIFEKFETRSEVFGLSKDELVGLTNLISF